jgi:hypothetical protein
MALGRHTKVDADNAIALGTGISYSQELTNNVENSLAVGFDTTAATFFVGGPYHRVGIKTINPESDFHVDGVVQIGSAETIDDTGAYDLSCKADWLSETDGGYGLGSSTQRWSYVWAVDGTINTSDARLKENVTDLRYGLEEVKKLRPVSFYWRDRQDDGLRIGLIAQEVQTVMSEVVASSENEIVEGSDGPEKTKKPAENLGIYYSSLVPVLVKAMQEQQGMIEQQAERIKELENRISELESR